MGFFSRRIQGDKGGLVTFRSFRVKAHWLTYLIALSVALAAFAVAWTVRKEQLWSAMQDAAHDAAREVGLSTRSARDSVYMLQGVANGLFQQHAIDLSPANQSAIVERLDMPGTWVMLPTEHPAHMVVRSSISNRFTSPSFSMVGARPVSGSEIGREIEVALTLSPALIRARQTQSAASAVYYLSGYSFQLIYPPANDDIQMFAPAMLKGPIYQGGLPENNPSRTPFWSDAYDDPKGNGLISTLSIPVDDALGDYRGVAAMDFQLDSLSQFVRRPALAIGTAFVLDEHSHVFAHPTMVGGASDHVPLLAEVAKKAGATGDWAALRMAPSNNRQELGNEIAIAYDIESTPWRYVLVVDRRDLGWAALRHMPFEAAGIVALMIILSYAEKRRREAVVSLRRKAAEDVLRAAPAPVAVLRQSDLSVMLANEALLHLFGVSVGVASSASAPSTTSALLQTAHLQLQQLMLQLSKQGLMQAAATLAEVPLHRADATLFWVLVRCVAMVHEDRPAWLCSLTDVTALKQAKDQLETLATTDPLTGALNRRAVTARAGIELRRASRTAAGFAALLLDIDHFKKVNDNFGHSTGDRVLQAVSLACQSVLRDVDVFGRWGGEEFIALLPDTELEGAETAAERIRLVIEHLVLEADDGAAIRTTVSIGVSVWLHNGDTLEALLMRGDAALYQAKGTGRNRVCIASQVSGGAQPASRNLQPPA